MNIKIIPKTLNGSVNSITSKSHAHRLMIAAALCAQSCKVNISNMNEDLYATRNCLSQLNDASQNCKDIYLQQSKNNSFPILDCNESGSTLRFMLPIAMALNNRAIFLGAGRLPERPLSPLKEEMEKHGCAFDKNIESSIKKTGIVQNSKLIFTVTGPLKGGTFTLPGNVSSQYITGLLFALPLLKEDSSINISSNLESIGYVMLTLEVLKLFGIEIAIRNNDGNQIKFDSLSNISKKLKELQTYSFFIKGNQQYISPGEVTAEGDWSNAAFWIVADYLSKGKNTDFENSISCINLNLNSPQGDKEIVSFVKIFNTAKGSGKKLVFDVSNVPDLVPILAVLATSYEGITEITNAGRLRIKESDRLSTVCEMIKTLGGNITELPEGLIIQGTKNLKGGTVNGHNDHRIVMATTIASILCTEPVTILDSEAVNKSYPTFFDDFSSLGGTYHVL